jgi:dihydrofolate reductase
MIRAVAAVDDCLGLATEKGIPWKVPADVQHFRTVTANVDVLMGYATYAEFAQPMPGRTNYVATGRGRELREGFLPVKDVDTFLSSGHSGDLWIIGGAMLFAMTLEKIQVLSMTRVEGDFNCTKFFPAFEDTFDLVGSTTPPAVAGEPAIHFQTWTRGAEGSRPPRES